MNVTTMKPYDAMFAAAVLVTVLGVAIGVLRRADDGVPPAPLRDLPGPQPVAVTRPRPAAPPAPQRAEAAPTTASEAASVEAEPAPAIEAAPQRSRRDMILGAWTLDTGGNTITMTFNPDGSLDFVMSNMPPEMPTWDATYTWESDDRIAVRVDIVGPNGESFNMDSGITIVELTENTLIVIDDRMGQQQTFTR